MRDDNLGRGRCMALDLLDVAWGKVHGLVAAGAFEDDDVGAGYEADEALAESRVAGVDDGAPVDLSAVGVAHQLGDVDDGRGGELQAGSFRFKAMGDLDVPHWELDLLSDHRIAEFQ